MYGGRQLAFWTGSFHYMTKPVYKAKMQTAISVQL